MIIIGVDPGLATFGLAIVELLNDALKVRRLYVLRTEASDKKLKVRSSSDLMRRARELDSKLVELLEPWGSPVLICAESLSYPTMPRKGGRKCNVCGHDGTRTQNVKTIAQLGIAWGIIAAIADDNDCAVAECSPQAMKTALAGSSSASKAEVQHGLQARFGEGVFTGIKPGDVQHAADALGAVVACRQHEAFLTARRLARGAA